MAKIVVSTQYSAGATTEVELPDGMTFDDIADDYYVKWGVFHFRRKEETGDDAWKEIDLNEDIEIDTKRPDECSIHRDLKSVYNDDDDDEDEEE